MSQGAPEFLADGGELGARMRAFDWSATPVGDPASWPHSLRVVVRILLTSRYAMWLGWGPELTFFYNDAYARMTLGAKHPWALGRSTREVWAEVWPDVGPRAEKVLQGGEATWDERLLLFLERRGFLEETYHTFSYSPVPDDGGGVGGMLCVVTEETERTIDERRLRTLRELSTATVSARTAEEAGACAVRSLAANQGDLPFALVYLAVDDHTFRLVAASGVAAGSAVAPAVVDRRRTGAWPFTTTPETVDDLAARFGEVHAGPWPEPLTTALVVPLAQPGQEDRLTGAFVAGVSPRRPLDEDYRGFVALVAGHVASAIAEARAYEAERQRAEQLAELDQAKTAFFSNVSHEFRTPLTLLLGPLEDLLAAPATADQRALLAVSHRNALRLQKLVNTLLDFSRIEAGRASAVYEPTDLAALTAELASNFRSACEKAGLRLTVDCPPLAEPVHVDRDQWEKIVLNLISNAFKFTLAGEIHVALAQVGAAVQLTVRDTGTGIADDQRPHIFERFHRVEGARARTHEGTGIGLALVQQLVKLHGGEIGVDSRPGVGSTFTVTIPLGTAHLPQDRLVAARALSPPRHPADSFVEEARRWLPEPAALPPNGVGPRVLLADDNADMRAYVHNLLAPDHVVVAVADGEQALAAVRVQRPDLVVSDIMMPGLDGFGLLRALRADPATAAIPVILLSARAGEEATVEGLAAGADDYLVKPFSARELRARVTSLLALVRARDDILQRDRQAAAADAKFRVLFEQSTQFAGILAPDGAVVELNRLWLDACGLARDECLGRPLWENGWWGRPPATTAAVRAACEAAAAGRTSRSETPFVLADGRERVLDLIVSPITDDAGRVLFLAATGLDITEQQRAEAALKTSEERLRLLDAIGEATRTAADPAAVMAATTRLLGVHLATTRCAYADVDADSDRFTIRHEWTPVPVAPSIVGSHSLTAFGPRVADELRAGRTLVLRDVDRELGDHATMFTALGIRSTVCCPLVKEGRLVALMAVHHAAPRAWDAREVALVSEVVERSWAHIERVRAEAALREQDRRKDEFLATLAHELRNPLAPLRNGLAILRMSPAEAALAERTREMMERQLGHMVRLIDDLLDISRVSRGKVQLKREPLEIHGVIDSALETSRPLLTARRHTLALGLADEPLWLDADPTRLAQIVGNLLNNAAKFTPDGGRIELATRRDGDHLELRVTDSGVGIPAAMLPRVFDLFVQGGRTIDRAQDGLGIGLSLAKKLTEMHGGTITAASPGDDLGSTFRVRLPLTARHPDQATPRPAPTSSATRRVLVVDDNVDGAVSLAMMLELTGHTPHVAHDGAAALATARAVQPELAFLDIGMPGMSGYELARRFRGDPGLRRVVLVALTGWGSDDDKRRAADAGFDHHLTKPVDLRAIAELLASLGL